MRKLLLILTALLCLSLCGYACAETVMLDTIHAKVDIPDDYILLTPGNLSLHPEWLASLNKTQEDLLADWTERGVLLQAWDKEGDACLEITAVQDAEGLQYFDIDEQTTATRASYRTSHSKNTRGDGWTYQSAEWKKTTQYGRFLMLKYKRTLDGQAIRGYARRTIRNGYTITVDYQVYGRSLKNADNNFINNLMKTWYFTQTQEKPATAVAPMVLESSPPAETNTGKFTISGTCDPGLTITAVAMRMSSPTPVLYETTVNKKGEFEIDVKLPAKGVWLMTLTVENGSVVTEERVFDTITYQSDLLPINMNSDCPILLNEDMAYTLVEDETVISGKTERNTNIQCIVSGPTTYDKVVKTNSSGKFSFTVDTSAEGEYEILLSFSKKNFSPRRFVVKATRNLTEEQEKQQIRNQAVKPRYGVLNDKLSGYTGRIMGYTLYPQKITQSGDEWILFMAMTKTKSGFKDTVVVIAEEEPRLTMGTGVKMYGKCVGAYNVSSEESSESYPCFQLLFWD